MMAFEVFHSKEVPHNVVPPIENIGWETPKKPDLRDSKELELPPLKLIENKSVHSINDLTEPEFNNLESRVNGVFEAAKKVVGEHADDPAYRVAIVEGRVYEFDREKSEMVEVKEPTASQKEFLKATKDLLDLPFSVHYSSKMTSGEPTPFPPENVKAWGIQQGSVTFVEGGLPSELKAVWTHLKGQRENEA